MLLPFKWRGKGSLLRHKPRWQEKEEGRGNQNTLGSSPRLSRALACIQEWLFLRWVQKRVSLNVRYRGSFLSCSLLCTPQVSPRGLWGVLPRNYSMWLSNSEAPWLLFPCPALSEVPTKYLKSPNSNSSHDPERERKKKIHFSSDEKEQKDRKHHSTLRKLIRLRTICGHSTPLWVSPRTRFPLSSLVHPGSLPERRIL